MKVEEVERVQGDVASGNRELVVLIHGYLDGPGTWSRLATALQAPQRLVLPVALQPLGHAGGSADVLEAYAAQVCAVIRSLPCSPSRVVLVGHSMGAMVAELAALRLGEAVEGLCLLTPAPLAGTELGDEARARFEARAGITDVETIKPGKRALAINLDDGAMDVLVSTTASTGRAFALEQLGAWTGGHPAGKEGCPLPVPVLIVATEDAVFSLDHLRSYARRFVQSGLVVVPGAGHWPQLEQPVALTQVIDRFLRQIA